MPKRVEVVDRVQVAHSKLLEGFSCTAVVAYLAETKGVSRRTAQRTVQQAYALIREDIDKANVQRSDLVAQAIHLLMESARLGLAQNNPGAVVGAVPMPWVSSRVVANSTSRRSSTIAPSSRLLFQVM